MHIYIYVVDVERIHPHLFYYLHCSFDSNMFEFLLLNNNNSCFL